VLDTHAQASQAQMPRQREILEMGGDGEAHAVVGHVELHPVALAAQGDAHRARPRVAQTVVQGLLGRAIENKLRRRRHVQFHDLRVRIDRDGDARAHATITRQLVQGRVETEMVQRGRPRGSAEGTELRDQVLTNGDVAGRRGTVAAINGDLALEGEGRLQRLVVQIGGQTRALLLLVSTPVRFDPAIANVA